MAKEEKWATDDLVVDTKEEMATPMSETKLTLEPESKVSAKSESMSESLAASSSFLMLEEEMDEMEVTDVEEEVDDDEDAFVSTLLKSDSLPTDNYSSTSCSSSSSSSSVSNLILAAIGVMKHRKARPDTKRICNWIHRRYGQSCDDVAMQLQKLVDDNKLVKVDYKGSSSYRIVDNSLSKGGRKKRMSSSKSNSTGVANTAGRATADLKLNNPCNGGSTGTSLKAIVMESFSSPSSSSLQVDVRSIAKAVAASARRFNKSSVLANLNVLLDQEVLFGHFKAVAGQPDNFILNKVSNEKTTNTIATVSNDIMVAPSSSSCSSSSSFSPLLPRVDCGLNNSDKSDEERQKDSLIQETVSKMATFRNSRSPPLVSPTSSSSTSPISTKEPIYLSLREKRAAEIHKKNARKRLKSNDNDPNNPTDNDSHSNGNSAFKLPSQVNSCAVSSNSNGTYQNHRDQHKAKRLREAKVRNLDVHVDHVEPPQLVVHDSSSKSTSRMSESNNNSKEEDDDSNIGSNTGRTGSLRKKKSRKIFDPADHDPPVRKRKSLPTTTTNGSSSSLSSEQALVVESKLPMLASSTSASGSKSAPMVAPLVIRRQSNSHQICRLCGIKGGKVSPLLKCKDCSYVAHPPCMDYSDALAERMLANASEWQCINCKKCSGCNEANDDELMLFCDSCDRGYHLSCHNPPVPMKPSGMWECSMCKHTSATTTNATTKTSIPVSKTVKVAKTNGQTVDTKASVSRGVKSAKTVNSDSSLPLSPSMSINETTKSFLPLLPSQLHPDKGLVPDAWESFPMDPNIPDVQRWNSPQICDYFAKQGFPDEQTEIFLNEEIDGNSLLLLSRSDVISSLGLKLGPALKLYHQVRRLQTRRNFPAIF